MIGSGVFMLPAALASFGGISMLGWVVSAAGSVLLALVFAHLSRRNPAAGGVYAYTRDSFGDFAGFLVAWGYWISIWSANAALSVAFVGYFGPVLHPNRRLPVSDRAVRRRPGGRDALVPDRRQQSRRRDRRPGAGRDDDVEAAAAGRRRHRRPDVVRARALRDSGCARRASSHGGMLLAVMTMTLFAFVGLESATIPAGSVKDPDRTIPRATMVGTLVTAAIYIVSTAGAMSLVAPEVLAKSTAPFAEAARAIGGDRLGVVHRRRRGHFGVRIAERLDSGREPVAAGGRAGTACSRSPFARVNATGMPVDRHGHRRRAEHRADRR